MCRRRWDRKDAGRLASGMVYDNNVKSAQRPNDGARRLGAVLSKLNESATKEERESRLLALERIASAVRARRSRPEASSAIPANPAKDRIRA